MKTNSLVTASGLLESSLPTTVVENYSKFVEFMASAGQANERIGFGNYILQNLKKFYSYEIYREEIVESNFLKVGLSSTNGIVAPNIDPETEVEDDDSDISLLEASDRGTIQLIDAFGFPDTNGIILIDDEVILYKRRVGNLLIDLKRGASATTVLSTLTTPGKFLDSVPAEHKVNSIVHNLSVLFVVAMLNNIHKSIIPNIESSRVFDGINHSLLLCNIKDFFQSKGTKLGIQSLFKILFGKNNVDVSYPGDQMIIPSESTWVQNRISRSIPVPLPFYKNSETWGDPSGLTGHMVELRSYNDDITYSQFYVELVNSYPFEDTILYDIIINEDGFSGNFMENPSTQLTRPLYVEDDLNNLLLDGINVNTITVDSTENFPDSGVVFIDYECIKYTSKSANQFFGCSRGFYGVAETHDVDSTVWGPYYLVGRYSNEDGKTITSRSWPTGMVSRVSIPNGGLLHTVEDPTYLGAPGEKDLRSVTVTSWKDRENTEDVLATQTLPPPLMKDVRNITYGVNGVYYDDVYTYIISNSLPKHTIGRFSNDNSVGKQLSAYSTKYIIPKYETIRDVEEPIEKGFGPIGVFLDGVPAYSNVGLRSIGSGKITSMTIKKAGSGYVNPTVIITPPGPTANAVVGPDGRIVSITLVESSNTHRYTSAPKVEISSGDGAKFSLKFDSFGRITSVAVTDGGKNYIDIPTLNVVDSSNRGRGAVISCRIVRGKIREAQIISPGIDYRPDTTYINVVPVGSGAVVEADIFKYHFDEVYRVDQDRNLFFDAGNGYLFLDKDKNLSRYGYMVNPKLLQTELGDTGSKHSPIIGWAFDGNPIYGPYGFVDGALTQHRSSYKLLKNRPTFGPSTTDYPMGTFVEDYEYNPTHGTLDEFNGTVCNTPEFPISEYPNGVYCYFLTVKSSKPVYPYIIGPNFHNNVISQNLPVNWNRVIRYRDDKVVLPENNIDIELSDVSTGSISNIFIQDSGSTRAAVGDYAYFNNSGTFGNGAAARVSWIEGKPIESVEGCLIQSKLISHRQRLDLSGTRNSNQLIFAVGSEIETFGSNNIARAKVVSYDPIKHILIVQTLTQNLIQSGDKIYDAKNKIVTVGKETLGSNQTNTTTVSGGSSVTTSSLSNVTILSYDEPQLRYDATELKPGDLWWSIQNGKLYIYYKDRNSSQWVVTQPYGTTPIGSFASKTPIGVTGTKFVPSGNVPTANQVIISDIAPRKKPNNSPLRIGDLWWSPVTGILYIWNSDVGSGGGCITCGCDKEGNPIEVSQEWICTDPSGSAPYSPTSNRAATSSSTFITNVNDINVVISAGAPSSTANATLWWSYMTGRLYIRYNGAWVVTNPIGSVSGQYSYLPTQRANEAGDTGLKFGTVALIPELETTKRLFFDSLCGFDGGDDVVLISSTGLTEASTIESKESNMFGSSMILSRDSNSNILSDGSIIQNDSKFKITVKTKIPHNMLVGDTVAFNSNISELDSKELKVIDVGYADIASGIALISAKKVIGVKITDSGNNYRENFHVTFSGGGGFGAVGLANVVNGKVTSVTIESGGESYESVPTVKFLDQCSWQYFTVYTSKLFVNPGITSYITSSKRSEGPVSKFEILSGGYDYLKLPVIPGLYKREFDRAITSVTMSGTQIQSINVLNGGNRYVNPKVVIWDENGSGRGAKATATVSNGVITRITIDRNGNGINYDNPQVLIYDEGLFIPETEDIGRIKSFNIIHPGRNINGNKSFTPSLEVETKLILEYPVVDRYKNITPVTNTWIKGTKAYSGSNRNKLAVGEVVRWEPKNQILTLKNVVGTFKNGTKIYGTNQRALIRVSGQSNQSLIVDGSSKSYGKYIDDKSFVSSEVSKIQDSKYYQLFSYVIESSISKDKYQSFVDNIIHPSGFVYFSKLNIDDDVNCNCISEDFDVSTYYNDLFWWTVPITSSPPLNPNCGDLWLDSTQGVLYIRYCGRNSSEWIAAGTLGSLT